MLNAYHPETPVLAVTQDTMCTGAARICWRRSVWIKRTSACDAGKSRIVVRPLTIASIADPDIDGVSGLNFHFHSPQAKEPRLFDLSDAARQSSDPTTSGLLRHAMGSVRRKDESPRAAPSVAHETLSETDAGASAFRVAFCEHRTLQWSS